MVRYTYNGSTLINPVNIIEDIRGNTTHNGCRLIISPDRKIYMTTGDAQVTAASQNVNDLSGKVLRFNLDGTIPADNPFSGSPVWCWGLRNSQGLWFHPNGKLYSSEHGPQTDDEFNIIMKGRNYGWPTVNGFCDSPPEMTFCNDSNVVEPLVAWTPTIAPSDIIWYDHDAIPEWKNSFLMTVLKDMRIISLHLDATGEIITSQKDYFVNTFRRLRDICIGPDGSVYIATNGNSWSNTSPFTHSIIQLKNPNYVPPVDTTSVREPLFAGGFFTEVYPNPADSWFQVRYAAGWAGGLWQIYDPAGRVVLTGILSESGVLSLERGSLPAGMYFLTAISKERQRVNRKVLLR